MSNKIKYWDIYITIPTDDDPREGYSVFVRGRNKKEAIQEMIDHHLHEYAEDLQNIKSITQITKKQFFAAVS